MNGPVGVKLRERAITLAGRKLSGQRLKDAKHFILWDKRRPDDIERLMAQLETLPDLVVDPTDRARVSGISPADRAAMQSARDAGAKLREIAARFRVATSTVSRLTEPRSRHVPLP